MGRSSSRLRGDELDRRIVNTDPERLRRQIMEQRRLETGQAKVCWDFQDLMENQCTVRG